MRDLANRIKRNRYREKKPISYDKVNLVKVRLYECITKIKC